MASSLSCGAISSSISPSTNLSQGREERGEESEEHFMEEKQLLLGESCQQSAIDPSLLRRMYVGHFLSRWGARKISSLLVPMASSLSCGAISSSISPSTNWSQGREERGKETEEHFMEEKQLLLGESSQQSAIDPSLLRRMYVGHFLSRWGARMWEFSVALYMINIWPDSLLLTAIYGVVEAASITLFGPVVGTWIEKIAYKQVLRMWLLIRSLSFLAAGGVVTALLVYFGPASHKSVPFVALLVITNISGAISVLSTLAGTILIEREWVVVISNGQPPEVLVRMNSIIRRIDLICKLLAPVLTGFIISFVSLVASSVILALWNVLSVWLEYWLWITVYDGFPALSENKQSRKVEVFSNDSLEARTVELNNISREGILEQDTTNWKRKITESLSKLLSFDAWIVYFNQDVVLPGVALALLYFSVLSFGTLMTATLEWKGIPAYVIGIARGISAIIGIMATVVYPVVHSRISTLRTGLWSIWTQWGFLLACLASIWINNSITSAWMLMGGVAASRLGLWMFDLGVMQLMQDQVSEADRCIVGGVQSSLQSMLDLLTYIMGIVVSDPRYFGQLVILSFILVSSAAILYTFHCYRVRKHLLHLDKILAKINWLVNSL